MKLPLNNLAYPVRILIGNSSGSGFIIEYKNQLYIVTAKHVLYQQNQATKEFSLWDKKMKVITYPLDSEIISKEPRIFELDLESLTASNDLRFHQNVDISVIKLGKIREESGVKKIDIIESIKTIQESKGSIVNYEMASSRKFDEVEVTNDVFVLGYPVSLSTNEMNQIDYNSPLVRKGIIAGKNYLNKSLILDCPVYGGNSGGLVLEISNINVGEANIHLIGVVVQFVPFVDQWRNIKFPELYNTNLQNSGYSVALPVDYIYDLIEEIEEDK